MLSLVAAGVRRRRRRDAAGLLGRHAAGRLAVAVGSARRQRSGRRHLARSPATSPMRSRPGGHSPTARRASGCCSRPTPSRCGSTTPDTMSFLEVNDAAVRHYGYERDAFLAMPVTSLGPLTEGPARHVLADGRVIDVEMTSHRLEFAGHDAVLVAVQDVTERNALDAQLRHQAFHDSLTGLSNRALFSDRVEHALGRRTGATTRSCCCSTSTASRWSTTRSVMPSATRCSSRSRGGSRARCARRHRRPARRRRVRDPARGLRDRRRRAAGVARAAGAVAADVDRRAAGVRDREHRHRRRASHGGVRRRPAAQRRRRDVPREGCRRRPLPDVPAAMFEAAARQMELTAAMRRPWPRRVRAALPADRRRRRRGKVTSMEALARWRHPDLRAVATQGVHPGRGGVRAHRAARFVDPARGMPDGGRRWPQQTALNVNLSGVQLADPGVVDDVTNALRESGLEPRGSRSRSPRASSCRTPRATCGGCGGCANSA